ncbi:MAG: 30S ribosomal protein S20 [Acidobacteriota bacterium]
MAYHKSAAKANQQAIRRRLRNRHNRSRLRTKVKKLRVAIASRKAEEARSLLGATISLIDHSAHLGALHHNAASRTKSRLTRQVNKLQAAGS